VRTESDVMRGEETQMVGLSSFFAPDEDEEVVSIFPGTHSKHITTKGGKLVDIRTYITGELFDLMVNHSILKDGISASARPMDENDATSFRKGVDQSKEFNLLNSLFRVRVNHLFKSLDSERNFYFLSGLLIGSELSGLANRNLQLCCGSNLYRLYRMAIEESGLVNSTTFIPPEVMDMAVVQGQWKIFSTFKNK
jgi:2-dehydro-3-deoxygalactonokinase